MDNRFRTLDRLGFDDGFRADLRLRTEVRFCTEDGLHAKGRFPALDRLGMANRFHPEDRRYGAAQRSGKRRLGNGRR
jgi:hypothetical protein